MLRSITFCFVLVIAGGLIAQNVDDLTGIKTLKLGMSPDEARAVLSKFALIQDSLAPSEIEINVLSIDSRGEAINKDFFKMGGCEFNGIRLRFYSQSLYEISYNKTLEADKYIAECVLLEKMGMKCQLNQFSEYLYDLLGESHKSDDAEVMGYWIGNKNEMSLRVERLIGMLVNYSIVLHDRRLNTLAKIKRF